MRWIRCYADALMDDDDDDKRAHERAARARVRAARKARAREELICRRARAHERRRAMPYAVMLHE